jgi:hypothetical protein
MSKLVFNGNDVWFSPPSNKNGLSKYPLRNISLNDFTFVTKVKIDWDSIYTKSIRKEVGIVMINGKHLGICANRFNENQYFIKGTIWTNSEIGNDIPNDIFLKVNEDELDSELDIIFSYNKNEKKIGLYCNGRHEEINFTGEIIDYTNSWLWIGAANAFENCAEDLRYYFYGEVTHVGIYQHYFNSEQILKSIMSPNTVNQKLNPICVFNFENQTPFKVFDISKNGNHLTKFDKSWMDSV